MFDDVKHGLTCALASALVVAFFASPAPAFAAPRAGGTRVAQNGKNAADEATFKEFQQIVADFSTQEKIQAWEAFLQKYPSSTYVPQVRQIITDLKSGGHASAPAPAATPVTTDPDLDFLNDSPSPTPGPISTPRPTPVARATPPPDTGFLDSPSTNNGGSARPPAHENRVSFNDAGGNGGGSGSWSGSNSNGGGGGSARSHRGGNGFTPMPPRGRDPFSHGIERKYHVEISPYVGISPDETYVRNVLFGVSIAAHLGRTWAFSLEGVGSQDSETPLLRSLRNLDAEPEVISKYNFMAGATVQANMLSAMNPVTNAIEGRNDLYVHLGAGDLNTDLEICKQTNGVKCASPLFINGVNFTWLSAGVGHRFYFTKHLLFRTEVRGRLVLELIDGNTNPRANVQVDLGPSFLF